MILFARPTALSGVASVLDLGGTLVHYVESNSSDQADSLALWCDWLAVGDDIEYAVRNVEAKHGAKNEWPAAALTGTDATRQETTRLPLKS